MRKPVKEGDFIFGRIADMREVTTEFGVSTACVMEVLEPEGEGFLTVWLSADLKVKLSGARPVKDRLWLITYTGIAKVRRGTMKVYSVVEIEPRP